jgi:Protein of unknown function (DUF3224)
MSSHAEGTFDVETRPIAADEVTSGTGIGRFALHKEFHGDLEAKSKGEMLGAGDPAKGSAGYVAMEQVTGTLNGHEGSFVLEHIGSMDASGFKLAVAVVPGSGTAQLTGIAGTMTIAQAAGKHSYTFDYTVPSDAIGAPR